MSKKLVRLSLALILVAFGAGTSASGCGRDPVVTVCDLVCFCDAQCTEEKQNACQATGREARKEAQESGCGIEFDRNQDCLQAKIRCEGTRATTEVCFPELGQLNACLQRAVPGGPAPGEPPPSGPGGE